MNISFTGRETMLTPKKVAKAVDVFFAETAPLGAMTKSAKTDVVRLASEAEKSYVASHGIINESKASAQVIDYFG